MCLQFSQGKFPMAKEYHRGKHSKYLLLWNFWVEKTFWSDGYFVCTTGDASADTIRQYIEEQG